MGWQTHIHIQLPAKAVLELSPQREREGGDRVVGKIMVNEKKESCGYLKMKEFPTPASPQSPQSPQVIASQS